MRFCWSSLKQYASNKKKGTSPDDKWRLSVSWDMVKEHRIESWWGRVDVHVYANWRNSWQSLTGGCGRWFSLLDRQKWQWEQWTATQVEAGGPCDIFVLYHWWIILLGTNYPSLHLSQSLRSYASNLSLRYKAASRHISQTSRAKRRWDKENVRVWMSASLRVTKVSRLALNEPQNQQDYQG